MEQIPPIIHQSWHPHLQPLFDDHKMKKLKEEILPATHFLPAPKDIFKVFEMPIDAIRVGIVGQDPYPNPGDAIGLAFAVSETTNIPKSLQIMRTEVLRGSGTSDIHPLTEENPRGWKTLQHWHKQGVFLLNTALTVGMRDAGSHLGYWQWFTERVVEIISKHHTIVWLLWGGKAQAFKHYVHNNVTYYRFPGDNVMGNELMDFNVILQCDHPAAETYNGGTSKNKFSGSNTFIDCNKILAKQGKPIINW